MSKAQVVNEMAANGYRFAGEYDGLPWQHAMAFERDENFRKQERRERAGLQMALGLERALAAGDLVSLAGFYAEEVTVLPGSELLKTKWGGAEGDRTAGARVAHSPRRGARRSPHRATRRRAGQSGRDRRARARQRGRQARRHRRRCSGAFRTPLTWGGQILQF